MTPPVAAPLLRTLTSIRDLDEAAESAQMASRASGADDFSEQVSWRQSLALVEAQLGHTPEGSKLAREAVDLARTSDWLNLRAETLEDLATVEASAGNTGDACAALDEAV